MNALFNLLHLKKISTLFTSCLDGVFLIAALMMFGSWASDVLCTFFQPVLDYFMQLTVFRGAVGAYNALHR